MPAQGKPGPFGGSRASGYFEYQIDHYLQNLYRRARGLPPLPEPEPPAQLVILRNPEVQRRTGLSQAYRWKLEQKNLFPKRVRLSPEMADAA